MENSSIAVNTIQSILNWSSNHVIEIIIFLGLFVEFSKIKINPISAILKFIFKPIRKEITDFREEMRIDMENLRKELKEEINSIRLDQEKEQETLNELIYANEMAEISRIRWEIIEFANSIGNGQIHLRDEYRHIKDDYNKYKSLIKKYDLKDIDVDEEMEKIEKHYKDHKDTPNLLF